MNKNHIIAIIVAVAVSIAFVVGALYYKGALGAKKEPVKIADGAEIEIEEGASGFACSCGCSSGNEMEDCKCEMCGEMKKEESSETKEVICYMDPETGEMVEIDLSEVDIEPMTKDKVDALESEIKKAQTLCIRRCESMIYDNGGEEPQFSAESESRYFYDASNNKVTNANGKDITTNLNFSVSKCKNSLDFLKAYFTSRGLSTDFVTDDVSHKRDLYMNQRVYSFGVNECEEISYLEEKMEGVEITQRDCTYQVKSGEDGVDRIVYVTVTVAGTDSDGSTVVRYITYIIEYDPVISE